MEFPGEFLYCSTGRGDGPNHGFRRIFRRRRGRGLRACDRASSARFSAGARPPTSARGNARWRSGSTSRSISSSGRTSPCASVSGSVCAGRDPRGMTPASRRPARRGDGRRRIDQLRRWRPRRDLGRDLRKFVNADLLAVGEHHRAEDRVLELAHIARPAIGRPSSAQRLGRDRAHALAFLGGEAGEEMAGQFGNVLARAGAAAAPRSETRAGGRTGPRGSARPSRRRSGRGWWRR